MSEPMPKQLSISVVTPSYQQARFIERTIRSVLTQDVGPLEYVVVDGGSDDGTTAILERYASRLRYVSEADDGQAHAVNKGIAMTSGAIIGWLNSDDVYYPGALAAVRNYFTAHPEVDVVYGNADHIDAADRLIEPYPCEPWDRERLLDTCYLCQPAVFFRRSVVERLGLIDQRLSFCMDYELWLRLAAGGARFVHLPRRLAGSRMYATNKTLGQRVAVHAEINDMLVRHLGAVPRSWISNYAHVVLEGRAMPREHGPVRFALQLCALTWWASLRWNHGLSKPILRMTLHGLRAEVGAWSRRTRLGPPAALPRARPLRVGLDVSQTGTRKAGCGYLAETMARALEKRAPHDFLVYPSFGDAFWDVNGPDSTWQATAGNFQRWPMPSSPSEARDFWRSSKGDLDAALGDPDIVHSFNFYCPTGLARARLVYTVYDLGFMVEPGWTTEANRQVCFTGVFQASLHADFIIAISEATRGHFLAMFPHYPAERTAVVRPPSRFEDCRPVARPPGCAHLTVARFFLYVGTIEPRKNLARLVDAYLTYRSRATAPMPLVLAGGEGWLMHGFEEQVRSLEASGQLIRLGYVDETTLQWLYQSCHTFVLPSLFEGFGLPVLEALSQGAAVITSRVASLPEVAGDAALYVNPEATDEIAEALTRIADDEDLRARMKAAAPRQAEAFSHRVAAEQILSCYARVMALERYPGASALCPGSEAIP